jgi:ATP-dependent DNA helicase RecG
LIQESVTFQRLGLVVVDEQHRFGVLQRERLRLKGAAVDVLVMTATPIPRTLALTAYGDLDTSLLDERPPGRTPVRTLHRSSSGRLEVVELVRRELRAGGQAYVVYPLVAESEKLEDVRAVTQMAEEWARELPAARIGILHGGLRGADKQRVMAAFSRGELDLLVATTVIEVGIDVKNASVMVIEHAERFGLAQLHQLRGRVGRGPRPATCVLLSHGRLSSEAKERLAVMVETDDGFRIAERDLEIRGPGDFFGTRQWGLPGLRFAELLRDRDLLEHARQVAFGFAGGRSAAEIEGLLGGFLTGGGWERRFGLAVVG